MEYEPGQYGACLDEFRTRLGRYDWMWRILGVRIRQIHNYPRRLHALLRRLGNPSRPYFVGCGSGGVRFLGDYRDGFSALCASDPTYSVDFLQFVYQRLAGRSGAYLDVGANVGFLAASVALHEQGRREVLAFEPVPETARRAAATFALNGVTDVRLFQAAVGDEDGAIVFYDSPGTSEWSSAHRTEQGRYVQWRETRVPCRSLDSLVREGRIGRVAFIKVDVEGHEPQVVRGARALITRDQPPIIYEYNHRIASQVGWQALDVAGLLGEMGPYRPFLMREPELEAVGPDSRLDGFGNIYCQSAAAAPTG